MVVNFDTGFPWLDTFLTVVLMILFTYPILGGFAWFIGGDLQSFFVPLSSVRVDTDPRRDRADDHHYGAGS